MSLSAQYAQPCIVWGRVSWPVMQVTAGAKEDSEVTRKRFMMKESRRSFEEEMKTEAKTEKEKEEVGGDVQQHRRKFDRIPMTHSFQKKRQRWACLRSYCLPSIVRVPTDPPTGVGFFFFSA